MSEKSERIVIPVGSQEAGSRLDVVLSLAVEDSSRSYLQKLIRDGLVTVD